MNYPNIHIHTFLEYWSFNLGAWSFIFPVSILKVLDQPNTVT